MPDPEQIFQKRQTAYKITVKDILNSIYVKTDGFNPNYLRGMGKEISRINVIGVVVEKIDLDNYKTLTIDDGTGIISSRVFENNILSDEINMGDIVAIIGRPREYSSEKYILIEIIKKIDPSWAIVRKLELKNVKDDKNIINKSSVEEEDVEISTNEIVKLIREMDKGDGVSIEEISSKDINDYEKIIDILLKGGDIFEVKPGKLKILE